jgi:integrase/ribosomal protein L40E
MDLHSVHSKRPESILKHWEGWGRKNGAPQPFYVYKQEAEKFYAWLSAKKGYSPSTLHKYLVVYRQLCLELAKKGLAPRDLDMQVYLGLRPAVKDNVFPVVAKLYAKYMVSVTGEDRWEKLYAQVKVPRQKQKLQTVLTPDQVKALLEECGRISFELKVLVELVYETGARAGEILHIRARDIVFDEAGAKLLIRSSKSEARAVRVVLYAADLARLVEGKKPEEKLFRQSYNTYLRQLREAWKNAGLPSVGRKFHALRHTRATELYGKMSEKAMMLWFGWRTRSMIDVYARMSQEEAEQEYLSAVGAVKRQEQAVAVQCPRCGYQNPGTASYCLRCGAPLKLELQLEKARDTLMLAELMRKVEELEKKLVKKTAK